jgi:hypothetical protein
MVLRRDDIISIDSQGEDSGMIVQEVG